jgi:hypothetical protein
VILPDSSLAGQKLPLVKQEPSVDDYSLNLAADLRRQTKRKSKMLRTKR